MLKIYNSFSSKIEDFEPFDPPIVKIFICGPTLYDYTHLGHARIFLTYDLLCRFLKTSGYKTDVLVNMTDINQSVFNKAIVQGTDYHTLVQFYSNEFIKDLDLLNIKSITRFAHVSDYVKSILGYISFLIEKRNAYYANGNVYFDTKTVKDYGKLSKQSRKQLSLHRMDIGPNKKNQEDFMLWNCSEDFGFSWRGDFGKGVPWWHIQDSSVAVENFGLHYDIHGGADELAYPHHEAHLAQYKAMTDSETPVKIWMYVSLVLSRGEKISKSLGNVVLARDLVSKYGQNLVRLYLFSTHYREGIDYSEKDLLRNKSFLKRIQQTRLRASNKTSKDISTMIEEFYTSLGKDLNSPKALDWLEKICTNTLKNSKISIEDFTKIIDTLGLSV